MISQHGGDRSAFDATKRDRFELLSAYLDGEASPDEKRLVDSWLTDDLEVQKIHRRLLLLRQALRSLPPTLIQPASSPTEQVLQHRRRRLRAASLAAACTLAALLVTGLGDALSGTALWQSARDQNTDTLELAVDEPAIELVPTAAGEPDDWE